jgi:two-component system sensor histidine kinase SenX3
VILLALAVAVVALLAGLGCGWALGRRADSVTQGAPPLPTSDGRRSESRARHRDVIAQAIDQLELGVVVCDDTGDVVFRNRAAEVFSGTHVGIIIDEHVERVLSSARSGEAGSETVDLHGPPRSWMAITSHPMPGGGAVATISDVSERARVDAMRRDFIANISHELRTPIGAIAVLADALVDEEDRDSVVRLAQRLLTESERAVQTVDDLLELSRIESASLPDEIVELDAIIDAVVDRSFSLGEQRGVRVSRVPGSDGLRVRGDGRQLASALANLVDNAVRYSDAGDSVHVSVQIHANAIEIAVVDDGIGIPLRDLDRVFERFYRVDRARSRETGGTGLGLAIVRHVATNHGGTVVVTSQEGDGSTFVLRLPTTLLGDGTDDRQDVVVDERAVR